MPIRQTSEGKLAILGLAAVDLFLVGCFLCAAARGTAVLLEPERLVVGVGDLLVCVILRRDVDVAQLDARTLGEFHCFRCARRTNEHDEAGKLLLVLVGLLVLTADRQPNLGAVNGTPYNLRGHEDIDGADTVLVSFVDAGVFAKLTEQNTANIDYLSAMSGIGLPNEEEDEEEANEPQTEEEAE